MKLVCAAHSSLNFSAIFSLLDPTVVAVVVGRMRLGTLDHMCNIFPWDSTHYFWIIAP